MVWSKLPRFSAGFRGPERRWFTAKVAGNGFRENEARTFWGTSRRLSRPSFHPEQAIQLGGADYESRSESPISKGLGTQLLGRVQSKPSMPVGVYFVRHPPLLALLGESQGESHQLDSGKHAL